MRRIILIMLGLTIVLSSPGFASDAAPADPGMEAMMAIAELIGRWEGEGWVRRGPSEPSEFRSVEVVEGRLDGRVLVVEGTHHAKEGGEIVHHALATISWNPETSHYRFSSHLADGKSGDYSAEMTEAGLVWSLDTPNGARIRYLIQVEGDRWDETGEYSADGENWQQFFAMSLQRLR